MLFLLTVSAPFFSSVKLLLVSLSLVEIGVEIALLFQIIPVLEHM